MEAQETLEAAEQPENRAPALPSVERRFVKLYAAEFREQSDKLIFEGRAAVYNEWADIGGLFREKIRRGAFDNVVANGSDVVFAFNHNLDFAMARSTVPEGPGSMVLTSTRSGLDVYAELAPTSTARDLKTLVTTGVVRQMSFGWPGGSTDDTWNEDYTERTILEFRDLIDVSPVVFPAYASTQASMRSLVDALSIALQAPGGDELQETIRSLLGERSSTAPGREREEMAQAETEAVVHDLLRRKRVDGRLLNLRLARLGATP